MDVGAVGQLRFRGEKGLPQGEARLAGAGQQAVAGPFRGKGQVVVDAPPPGLPVSLGGDLGVYLLVLHALSLGGAGQYALEVQGPVHVQEQLYLVVQPAPAAGGDHHLYCRLVLPVVVLTDLAAEAALPHPDTLDVPRHLFKALGQGVHAPPDEGGRAVRSLAAAQAQGQEIGVSLAGPRPVPIAEIHPVLAVDFVLGPGEIEHALARVAPSGPGRFFSPFHRFVSLLPVGRPATPPPDIVAPSYT